MNPPRSTRTQKLTPRDLLRAGVAVGVVTSCLTERAARSKRWPMTVLSFLPTRPAKSRRNVILPV